jgi:hypothetical protein
MGDIGRRCGAAVLIAGLVACAKPPAPPDAQAAPEDHAPLTTDSDATPPAGIPEAIVSAVREDLAQRSGAAPGSIHLVSARAMRWNDGSMGCPQPGQSYMQVIVDGFQVILEAQGHSYDYRTNGRGGFVLCENPSPNPGGQPRDVS